MSTQTLETYTGSRLIEVKDNINDVSFPVLIHYPTNTPSSLINIGPYTFDVSPDAEIAPGKYPLVVLSHGNGGSHLLYRNISTCLAKNGYIVAMPEHPGNNRNDNTLEGTTEILINRPRHVILAMNAFSGLPDFRNSLMENQVAVIGHALGGYTALALAGGIPCTQQKVKIEVEHDERVKAIVLLAPVAGCFINEGSLCNVHVPILMFSGEHDKVTPYWNAEVVLQGVPDPVQVVSKIVTHGGHFSFLSRFQEQMQRPGFLPVMDSQGFDRQKFHEQLPLEILGFLDEHLKPTNEVDPHEP